ncbi:hypothetical protein B0T17DRAFT_610665 [Bombardia bombarda]|uniref:Mitochondrial adapter protein MCP1 transmembrane domain-containing protein n=1 Tax=Bombardia bombarda TaxID=252184 RepID=A0AA39U643_9PEZI|nr:hypothetical protein B0T17DRAFT_610665 [Bombardia bombarda]
MDSQALHAKASQDTLASLLQLDPLPIESPPISRTQTHTSTHCPDPEKDLPLLPEAAHSHSHSHSHSHPHHHIHQPSSDQDFTAFPLSRTTSASTHAGLGLSGTGHGAIYYLTRVQRYSSYTFSLFATLHLATTSIIPLVARSVPASESYLLLAREIYQTPLSEPLLVALPIAAHVGAGIALRLVRRAQNIRRYYGRDVDRGTRTLRDGWPPLSCIALSGYGSAVVLGLHILVNRALPLAVEGDSANIGLAYVAHGFARRALVSWVSYGALLGLGCGHMVWGWAKWFGVAQHAGWRLERHTGNAAVDRRERRQRRRMLMGVNAVAVAAAAVWAAGGLGVVARGGETLGWVGRIYDGLYGKIPGF